MSFVARILGNIVLVTFLAGVLLVLCEMLWYRLPPRRGRKAPPADALQKRIALITGATSGLGREYARLADKKLKGIDEIWLVGRREAELRRTASLLSHPSRCLVLDLTKPEAFETIRTGLAAESIRVGCLINCAGFAKIGRTDTLPLYDQLTMVDLNCRAAMALTDACLPRLTAGDRIINVCSTAGFQPFQHLNVYAASKAYLLRYSRALRLELLPRRIAVTAVCPYWIRDTEFIGIAAPKGRSAIRSYPLSSRVRSVARLSLTAARLGLPISTPGIVCTAHRIFSKLLPDTALLYIWEIVRRI